VPKTIQFVICSLMRLSDCGILPDIDSGTVSARASRMAKIQTYTGRLVSVPFIREEDVCLEDIAHSLSMQCRFNGHTDFFYSVLHHSLLGSKKAEYPTIELAFLLHDAAEAYTGDIATPLKRLTKYSNSRMTSCGPVDVSVADVENRNLSTIFRALGIECLDLPQIHCWVKEIDTRMLVTEAGRLMKRGDYQWRDHGEPYTDIVFNKIEPEDIKRIWMMAVHEAAIKCGINLVDADTKRSAAYSLRATTKIYGQLIP